MANKVEQLELSFTLNAQSVEQAGAALRAEIEKGLGSISFDALRRNAASTSKQIGADLKKALTQEVQIDTKSLDRTLSQYQAKRQKIERQLAVEAGQAGKGAAKTQASLDASRLKELRKLIGEERKLFKERGRSMALMNEGAKQYLRTMKQAAKYAGGGTAPMKVVGGVGKMPNMGGGLPQVKGGGKAKGGMAKRVAGSMGKGGGAAMQKAAPMLGKAAAGMGKAAAALGVAATAIGATVGVIAGLLAVIMAADSKMKDFNKTLLSSVGGADLLSGGYDGVADSVDNMRNAAIGAQFRLKSLAKDNIEILKTLHEHGHTMREMAKDTSNATQAMMAYGRSMELVLTYSRMIGESATKVAQDMATTGEELGMTLEGVAKKFSTISRFAMESGFSTKRFFSMVIQATSGMSMYNVRLEEASGLLVRIGKILGQKTGGEFLQSLTKGFVNESMTARIKRVMLTGKGNTKDAMQMSADNTATDFQSKLEDANLNISFKDLGINRKGGLQDVGSKELTQILSKLDPRQAAFATAKMAETAQSQGKGEVADGLRQQLQTLISISQGSKGGLLNMAKNLDSLDMGGKLNMMRNSMKAMFNGKELYELNAKQLAAVESATGMSGEQLQQMRELSQGMDGNFRVLQTMKGDTKRYHGMDKTQREKAQKDQIKAYGAYVNDQGKIIAASIDEDGNIQDAEYRDKNGKMQVKELKKLGEYYQSQGKRLDAQAAAQNFNEDRAIQQEIANNTWSMADMLSGGITIILNGIYGIVRGILAAFDGNAYKSAMANEKKQMDALQKETKRKRKIDKELRDKEREAAKEADPGKRNKLEKEITALKIESEKSGWRSKDIKDNLGKSYNADGTPKSAKQLGNVVAGGVMSQIFGDGAQYNMTTYDTGKDGINLGISAKDSTDFLGSDSKRLQSEAPTLYKELMKQAKLVEAMPEGDKKKGKELATEVAGDLVDAVGHPSQIRAMDQSTAETIDERVGVPGSGVQLGLNVGDRVTGSAWTRKQVKGLESTAVSALSPIGLQQTFQGTGLNLPTRDAQGNEVENNQMKDDKNRFGGEVWAPLKPAGGDGAKSGTHMGYTSTIGDTAESEANRGWSNTDDGSARHSGHRRRFMGETTTTNRSAIKKEVTDATGLEDFRLSVGGTVRHGGMASQSFNHHGKGKVVDAVTAAGFDDAADIKSTQKEMANYFTPESFRTAEISRRAVQGTYRHRNDNSHKRYHKATYASAKEATNPEELAAAAAGLGGDQGNVKVQGGGADGIMRFISEMKILQKETGQLGTKEDGSAYSLEDLNKDIKAAYDANGGNLLTMDQFKQWMQENRPVFKSIEGNLKANKKSRIALEKMRKMMKEEKDETKEKQKIGQQLAGYAGLTEKQGKRLAKGDLPAANSAGMNRLKELVGINDPFVLQALGKLGINKASVQDFIYQGGAKGGVITPIHSGDDFLGMRDRGSVDNALARNSSGGGTGTINVNVYSNNLEEVKRAIYQAAEKVGVGGRMRSRAGRGYGSNKSGVV